MSENQPPAETSAAAEAAHAEHTNDQYQVRLAKRAEMLERGLDPYPVELPLTSTVAAVVAEFGGTGAGVTTDTEVALTGRVMFVRDTGKLVFATIQDGQHNTVQLFLSQKLVGAEELADFKRFVDMGDQVFARGTVGASRRGELSVFVEEWRMASKSVRPLPVLHADLNDEYRMRHRSVDLIVSDQAQKNARDRVRVNSAIRDVLRGQSYLELETPTLQAIPSGAAARPFSTHMNAYDLELYLRIALELHLKQAVVGGLERVFEIGRVFRNEGADSTHSPEFTMLEAYQSFATYDTMATLTREMIQASAVAVAGSTLVTLPDGTEYDFGGEWGEISLYHSLSEALGEEITHETPAEHLRDIAEKVDAPIDPAKFGHGKLVEEIWEHLTPAEALWAPVFVKDFPVETSPLVRPHRAIPGVVEKWDLYVRGVELATAYSELADPVIQRERFVQQAALAAGGDEEAMQYDEDFVRAMEFGFPPAGGMGMGMDRLLTAVTGYGIRDTILFPLVKPLEG